MKALRAQGGRRVNLRTHADHGRRGACQHIGQLRSGRGTQPPPGQRLHLLFRRLQHQQLIQSRAQRETLQQRPQHGRRLDRRSKRQVLGGRITHCLDRSSGTGWLAFGLNRACIGA